MGRTVMVTGASGQLGRSVVRALIGPDAAIGLRAGDRLVLGTRTPAGADGLEVRAVDFDAAPDVLERAFEGVDRLLIVSTDAVDRPGRRAEQHVRAIAAARAAGVQHLVYTSFSNPVAGSAAAVSEDHRITEEAIRASGLGFTLLRNNLYAELLLMAVPRAVATGQLVTAQGDGRIAYVSREDCALAAAAALVDRFDGQRAVSVSGPEALGGAEIAAIAADLTDRPVAFVPVPADAWVEGAVAGGLPAPFAKLLVSFDVAASRGELDEVSDGLSTLAGRAPRGVRDLLRAHRDALTP